MPTRTAIAVLTTALQPGATEIQLLPAGEFRAVDGRPNGVLAWRMDDLAASRVLAAARARRNPFVIDYEHQTLLSEKNGQAAPAGGWFHGADLDWRPGRGLFATNVAWTAKAATHIAASEYRYISPVFEFDPHAGDILAIKMAALTNTPGLDGMDAISVALTAALAQQFFPTTSPEETPVNETLKKLLAVLGLPETTTEADAMAGVAALKSQSADQTTQIAALKSATPDPEKYVAVGVMQSLQTEVAALSARLNQGEASQVIDTALSEGRLLPAQRTWAEELGKSNLAALKSYVAATPANPALAGMQTDGKALGGTDKSSDADLAVCKALGLTPEQFAKGKIKQEG